MIGRTSGSLLRVLTAIVLLGIVAGVSNARAEDADKTAQIEKAFREGVDLYQQGRFAEAQKKLKEVLALDPRKELAARLVDEAGTKIMAKMMADVRMGNEPTYIWQYYRQYQVKKLADKERMTKMAARLVDATTSEDERALLYREFGELAHYSVPYLAPHLKDATHEDHRTFARIAIARMGSRAVLPVIELLSHKEVLMRENAVLVLADIQPLDPRAIPALKARMEDAAEQASVKNYAARTLARITGLDAAATKAAADYYYDLANRYYLDRAGVAEEAEDVDGTIWHLNDAGDLIPVQYPLWAWNEQMAEENVLKGLAIKADHADFPALWASVMAAEGTEVKDLLDIVNEQPAQHTFSAEEKKEIEAWNTKLVDARRLARAVGKENVNAALNKVHADIKRHPGHGRLPQVGAYLAGELAALDPAGALLTPPPEIILDALPGKEAVIARVGAGDVSVKTEFGIVKVTVKPSSVEITTVPPPSAPNGKEGKKDKKEEAAAPAPVEAPPMTLPPAVSTSGLVNGLDSSEEAVQYACALALASTDRFPSKWIGSEKVAAILGRGVSENKAPQFLVVEENHNTANELRGKLEALGYGVTVAISGRDAVVQARSFPPKDGVIVADNLRRDLTAEQLLEELRADTRTRYLPAGILALRADRNAIGSRFSDPLIVEREATGNDLKTMADAILAKRAAETVTKRKAGEVAVACATALSKVDPRDTMLNLDDAVQHCINALVNRKDEVRNPAAIFLGRVEGGSKKADAADKLKAVVLDANNAVELRRNALRALGRVQPDGVEDVYLKVQADADQEIKDIGAEALGQKSRDPKTIINFISSQRIDKDKKEK